MAVVRSGSGRLTVTLTAKTSNLLPRNALDRLRFKSMTHAVVDVPGGPTGLSGEATVELPDGTQQTTFVVRRTGLGAAMVHLDVFDGCNGWSTFVGGGPDAF